MKEITQSKTSVLENWEQKPKLIRTGNTFITKNKTIEKKSKSFYLDKDSLKLLKEVSIKLGISESDIVRQCLKKYLSEHQEV